MPERVEIREVEVLRLKPGDVIVYRVGDDVDADTMRELRDHLAELFPGHRGVITQGGSFQVIDAAERDPSST